MRPLLKVNGRNRYYVDLDRPTPGTAGRFERIPGVTTIVKDGLPKPALMNWAGDATAEYAVDHWDELAALPIAQRLKEIKGGRYSTRDAAADKGTEIHRCAEKLIAGHKVAIPEGLEGYVDACVAFFNQFDVKPFAVEMLVYSETHYYCGRLDIGANVLLPDGPEWDYIPRDDDGRSRGLFDLKSGRSGIWGDLSYQLAPYAHAEWAIDEFGEVCEVPEFDFAAGVHVRGDGGYTVTPVEVGVAQFDGFLKIKAVAEELERTRDYMLEAITPPLENTYRLTKIED